MSPFSPHALMFCMLLCSLASARALGVHTGAGTKRESEALFFEPPIAPECASVAFSPAYLVYWLCSEPRCASCEGTPAFVGNGGADRCFETGFPSMQLVTLTYLACSVDKGQGCVWSADYNFQMGNAFPKWACTTGLNKVPHFSQMHQPDF